MLLFHILAPEELDFPFKKWTQFRDLEVLATTAGRSTTAAQGYQQNFQRSARTCATPAASAVDYHLVRTDEPVEKASGRLFDAAAAAEIVSSGQWPVVS